MEMVVDGVHDVFLYGGSASARRRYGRPCRGVHLVDRGLGACGGGMPVAGAVTTASPNVAPLVFYCTQYYHILRFEKESYESICRLKLIVYYCNLKLLHR
jgi:hypothetical protein